MLIKIWSAVTAIVNEEFVGLQSGSPSFVAAFSDEMAKITGGKQRWLINLVSESEYSGSLIERSVGTFNQETSGSLVCYTEGYQPIFSGRSLEATESHLRYLLRHCEIFNKRVVYMTLPVFAGASAEQKEKILEYNKVLKATFRPFDQEIYVANLIGKGSDDQCRITQPKAFGEHLAKAVIYSHSEGKNWIDQHGHI